MIVSEEYRPVQFLPLRTFIVIWTIVLVTLVLQVRINLERPPPKAGAIDLPSPMSQTKLSAISLGDKVFTAKALMLWLQAFDNQQGQSLSFSELDYDKIVEWLEEISDLDPKSAYPLMSAANIYAELNVPEKIRKMVDFIAGEFDENPALNWQWMVTAATLAKHKLEDPEYALELARRLRVGTKGIESVPNWVRQMEIFLLQDQNSYDASASLVLSLIRSGQITDEQEFALHLQRLTKLREELLRAGLVKNKEELERMQRLLDQIQEEFLKRADTPSS